MISYFQKEGYPRYQKETSIFADWLHSQHKSSRNPSGHLKRKQNKYLQLSSSLFGDQEERDRIRITREVESQESLRRQLQEVEEQARLQKVEDERVFDAMAIGHLGKKSHKHPETGLQNKKGNYEPSFSDKDIKSKRDQLEYRKHSLDSSVPTQLPNYRYPGIQEKGNFANNAAQKNNPQYHFSQGQYHPGYPQRFYPQAYQGSYPQGVPFAQRSPFPPPFVYPPNYYRSVSYPALNYHPNNKFRNYPRSYNDYLPSERELEADRQEYLRYQVEERKAREQEQRQREEESDLILEQNTFRQREKLRLEYEADLAKEQAKQKVARRQEKQIERLTALKKEAEEEKKAKVATRKGRGDRQDQFGSVQEIPRIIIDTVDDRPIKPTKIKSFKTKIRSERSPSKVIESVDDRPVKPAKIKNSKSRKSEKFLPDVKDKKSTSKTKVRKSSTDNKPQKLPRSKSSGSLTSSILSDAPPTTSMRRSGSNKQLDYSSSGAKKKIIYTQEDSEEINIQEKDGKRRRLPSKRTDDFGIHVNSVSKPLVVSDETFTSTVYDDKFRPRIRKKPHSKLEKLPREPEERTGSHSAPLPPIPRSSPKTPREPPPPFDWKIQLEENDEEVTKLKESNQKKIRKFQKKNKGFLSQLSALKTSLKQSKADEDDGGDDNNSDDDTSEKENGDEDGDSEEEKDDDANEGNFISEEDFNRKVSLGDTQKLDLDATNKTMLRNFMNRFSRKT